MISVQLSNKDRDIAFVANLGPNMVNSASGATVVFDHAITNTRNHYDPNHGVFTVPVNGTDHFHFVGASPENKDPGHSLHLYLVKNA